jgi:hypothetical protein
VNKHIEGRGKATVKVDCIMVRVGAAITTYECPFFVDVEFYYESEIKATEDEPGCNEYVEAFNIRLLEPIYLVNDNGGVSVRLDDRCNLVEVLTMADIERIETDIKLVAQQPRYPEPIRTKLCTSDNLRLPEDDEVMRNLGHQLKDYRHE